MTPKYQHFIFEDYEFNADARTLSLHYSFDGIVSFTEKYHFDFTIQSYDASVLDLAFQQLFFIAGVSYYKTYLAPDIVVKKGRLDQIMADFYAKTYQRGLGEFFFINHLDPRTPIPFPTTTDQSMPILLLGVSTIALN
jgi:hypothetical protein